MRCARLQLTELKGVVYFLTVQHGNTARSIITHDYGSCTRKKTSMVFGLRKAGKDADIKKWAYDRKKKNLGAFEKGWEYGKAMVPQRLNG